MPVAGSGYQQPLARRLALGTAQFGLAYGIANTEGKPTEAQVSTLLAGAAAAGIDLLDTAAAYGDSEERLGRLAGPDSGFAVVTKVAAGRSADVLDELAESVWRLRRESGGLHGVLFHDVEAARAQPDAWKALRQAREQGTVARAGASLYHPEQARWLLDGDLDVDLVQVPFNVLDQRFADLLPELAARGVEVHVRSAFLQGLLLLDPAALPAYFRPLEPTLRRLRAVVDAAGVPLAAALLLFAADAPGVARAVIGVGSPAELAANLAAEDHRGALQALRPALQELAQADDTYLLPYTWPAAP